jgi:hypothetical protein
MAKKFNDYFSKGSFLRTFLFLWLVFSLLASIPVFSAWMLNSYMVFLVDLVVPLILTTLSALITALVYYRTYQKDPIAGFIAGLFSVSILSVNFNNRLNDVYNVLASLNPFQDLKQYKNSFFAFVLVIIVFLFGLLIGKIISNWIKLSRFRSLDWLGGIFIFVLVSFGISATVVLKTIIVEWPQFFYRPPLLSDSAKLTPGQAKPDVYYIVLDRYTSQDILASQFNFDNSPFINFLQSNNFVVNPNAHQNYPYTAMSISSTLNANYQTDLINKFSKASAQTVEPYQDAIRYSSVVEQFKALGYQFDQLGTWYESSNQAPLANYNYQPDGQLTLFNHTITLNNFSKNQLSESPYWNLVNLGFGIGHFSFFSYSGISQIEDTQNKLNILNQMAKENTGGRFIFTHFLTPHDPYYYNADGSLNAYSNSDNYGEPIKEKYVNQVQYINTQMESLINNINSASHDQAIIIIQSDEGPYPIQLNDQDFDDNSVNDELAFNSMLDWSNKDLLMKYGILAAYHLPQASKQLLVSKGNSVNIFRILFNTYFQANLTYLPECYYAYPDGRGQPFVYQNINKQLTGSSNPACPIDSVFSSNL